MTPLIYFRCRNSDHQLAAAAPNDAQPGSPITWHEGRWAYCPRGLADGHDWLELKTGYSVAEVRTRSTATV